MKSYSKLYLPKLVDQECFASVYKRDKLNTADFEDLMIIREGTVNVRGGNCIIDVDI